MSGLIKYRSIPATKNLFEGFIEDFLNRDIAGYAGGDTGYFQPAVNISETKANFLIELAAPGFDKQDFEVKVEGNQLAIRGNQKSKQEKTDGKFTRREFQTTAFYRSFTLPESVNQNEVSAVYQNGILEITLPKKPEAQPATKTIEIGG